ncbi:PilZ domain-containing protein [Desulfocurvibacter africanus]|uniref:PilZ domain-containing protein n=1 Tax=Desulfocurvibacter africanus TaxID=873 RepID=UPI00040C86F0|nr:PilZ domain-containing protein [Desulfocurvibacter africanus]
MTDEKRRFHRRKPQHYEYVLFSTEEGQRMLCPLEDLSAGGMRIGCSGEAVARLTPKLPISIDDCPQNLRNVLRRMRGEIVWAMDGSRGVSFYDDLCVTNQELHALLDEPKALPWADWPE